MEGRYLHSIFLSLKVFSLFYDPEYKELVEEGADY